MIRQDILLNSYMFKASKNSQGDMFKNIGGHLCERKLKILEARNSWHNVFYREVVSRIDESMFSVLYHDKMGRPNASIRVLIGMMILKEGNGWSDEQLFTECRFNIMIMRGLGLYNMDDDVPTESTYYEFRKLLGQYYEQHNQDLIKETFLKITTQQVAMHGVSGKKIRLDSKLINSNIAKSNRLYLIVEAVRKYISGIHLSEIENHMDAPSYKLLESLQSKSTSNITYPLNGQEKKKMLVTMGQIIRILLELGKGIKGEYYSLLKRIYEEQYEQKSNDNNGDDSTRSNQEVVPKRAKDIPSSSVQSIHDPDAAYRTKGDGASKQTVSGYHSNVTESCDPDEDVHLILDVEVVKANVSEDAFLIKSVDTSEQIIHNAHGKEQNIEEVITDGGYDSIANREEMLKEDRPQWSVAKMKGRKRVYQMDKDDKGKLVVCDSTSGEQLDVHYSQRSEKYVIQSPNGQKRYMTKKQIDNYIQHQQIEDQVNEESYNLRATVESTIHQNYHRLKKRNKIVYRGLIKCQWYAISRAFWVNIVRITKKEGENALIFIQLLIQYHMDALILNRKKCYCELQLGIKSNNEF